MQKVPSQSHPVLFIDKANHLRGANGRVVVFQLGHTLLTLRHLKEHLMPKQTCAHQLGQSQGDESGIFHPTTLMIGCWQSKEGPGSLFPNETFYVPNNGSNGRGLYVFMTFDEMSGHIYVCWCGLFVCMWNISRSMRFHETCRPN